MQHVTQNGCCSEWRLHRINLSCCWVMSASSCGCFSPFCASASSSCPCPSSFSLSAPFAFFYCPSSPSFSSGFHPPMIHCWMSQNHCLSGPGCRCCPQELEEVLCSGAPPLLHPVCGHCLRGRRCCSTALSGARAGRTSCKLLDSGRPPPPVSVPATASSRSCALPYQTRLQFTTNCH